MPKLLPYIRYIKLADNKRGCVTVVNIAYCITTARIAAPYVYDIVEAKDTDSSSKEIELERWLVGSKQSEQTVQVFDLKKHTPVTTRIVAISFNGNYAILRSNKDSLLEPNVEQLDRRHIERRNKFIVLVSHFTFLREIFEQFKGLPDNETGQLLPALQGKVPSRSTWGRCEPDEDRYEMVPADYLGGPVFNYVSHTLIGILTDGIGMCRIEPARYSIPRCRFLLGRIHSYYSDDSNEAGLWSI